MPHWNSPDLGKRNYFLNPLPSRCSCEIGNVSLILQTRNRQYKKLSWNPMSKFRSTYQVHRNSLSLSPSQWINSKVCLVVLPLNSLRYNGRWGYWSFPCILMHFLSTRQGSQWQHPAVYKSSAQHAVLTSEHTVSEGGVTVTNQSGDHKSSTNGPGQDICQFH